jgi:hypothetical protein
MKPLLFIEILYNQTIKGLKTMTRREGSLKAINDNPDEWRQYLVSCIFPNAKTNMVKVVFENDKGHKITLKPRLLVGDIVRLNEPYLVLTAGTYGYRFNGGGSNSLITSDGYKARTEDRSDIKWKNKLFMPADAARAFVKITGVKCERLLDISDEDCIAEGIEKISNFFKYKGLSYKNYQPEKHPVKGSPLWPIDSFLSLFKFANKIKADAPVKNKWLWCYTYVLCDKEGKEINHEN